LRRVAIAAALRPDSGVAGCRHLTTDLSIAQLTMHGPLSSAEPVPPAGHPHADRLRVGCRAAREAGTNVGTQAWAGALARFDGRWV
jgi:hypothetical protein